jgi:DNA polymerase/3'-5' exonuclease PolX
MSVIFLLTGIVQLLLWRDHKAAAKAKLEVESAILEAPGEFEVKIVGGVRRAPPSVDDVTEIPVTAQPKL